MPGHAGPVAGYIALMTEDTALYPLRTTAAFRIRQIREWGEILAGWETKNRYEITDEHGTPLWIAGELRSGIWAILLRNMLDHRRPFTLELRDAAGRLALKLVRRWRWLFSRLDVHDGRVGHLGTIQQRWTWVGRRFDVLDANGQVIAELRGPWFKPWTFNLVAREVNVGTIMKKWSGIGRELFTDSDNFGVTFEPAAERIPSLKPLVLAATFLIDFMYFETRR